MGLKLEYSHRQNYALDICLLLAVEKTKIRAGDARIKTVDFVIWPTVSIMKPFIESN